MYKVHVPREFSPMKPSSVLIAKKVGNGDGGAPRELQIVGWKEPVGQELCGWGYFRVWDDDWSHIKLPVYLQPLPQSLIKRIEVPWGLVNAICKLEIVAPLNCIATLGAVEIVKDVVTKIGYVWRV
jgi:hypothetical protein